MSPRNLPEATRLISEFLEFAHSGPPIGELDQALAKVLSVPKHVVLTAALEDALEEVRNLYPDESSIELKLALLPARNEDHYRASERLAEFLNRFSTHPLGYIKGIQISQAANLYDQVYQMAWQALENLDRLVPFGPTEFSALLVQAGQIGRHPLFFELCTRFGKWLNEMPAYRSFRFTRVADNLGAKAYEQITFVSLGTNCLPWTVGNRWGFRPLLTGNKQQLPLNYGQQTAQSCSLMLHERFVKLSDANQYVLTRGPYGFDIAMQKGYRFMFNHELGQHWLEQGCGNLVSRYKERVTNFFSYAISGPRVYVLYLPWNIDIRAIARAIAELSVDENYRLLVIDSRAVPDGTELEHPNIMWRKISLPSDNFVWWQQFDTEEGVHFETAIHDAMRDAARELVA
jgi:hypothetical protein